MKPFSLKEAKAGKPVITKQGHDVRICGYGKEEMVGFITLHGGEELATSWNFDGLCGGVSNCNALRMKTKQEGWVIVYFDMSVSDVFGSEEEAKNFNSFPDSVITKIEWEI